MSNVDERVNFANGSDSGQDESDAIQPVNGAEYVTDVVADRPLENLRVRTQILKNAAENLNYLSDYDRALLFQSTGTFTLSVASSQYTIVATADLWIYPALTPGRASGGRNAGAGYETGRPLGARLWVGSLPYAGTAGVNDLQLIATPQYTGQRGYADGQNFDGGGGNPAITLGANNFQVSLVANSGIGGGLGSITVAYTGNPKTLITITYGTATPTYLSDIITFINSDYTSGTGYGLANYFRAFTSPGVLPGSTAPPALTGGIFQGAYDAEAFQVTLAQWTSFFGISSNLLLEGEGLAISFPAGPVQEGAGAIGGRRQSIWDLPTNRTGTKVQNTTPSVGYNLFNTGREPEKIPNSIPIGKIINGVFCFADGTTIPVGGSYMLTESAATYAKLSVDTPPSGTGATLVGFAGNAFWNDDDNTELVSTNVQTAINEIVTDLASETVSHSGARRIGTDAVTGSASAGNNAYSLPGGQSLHEQMTTLLTAGGASGAPGGLNSRVSEYGHKMHGPLPIDKDFNELPGTFGQEFLRLKLQPSVAPKQPYGNYVEDGTILLQPFTDPTNGVTAAMPIDNGGGAASYQVHLVGVNDTAGSVLGASIPNASVTGTTGYSSGFLFHAVVQLQGIAGTGATLNAYYYVENIHRIDATHHVVTLLNIDGSTPNFALGGVDYTLAVATFYYTVMVGADSGNRRIRAVLPSTVIPFNSGGTLYQGGGTAPISLVGSSGQLGAPGYYPLIDIFTPGGEDTQPVWMATITPRRAIWAGNDSGLTPYVNVLGDPTFGFGGLLDNDSLVRNTDNILVGADAKLLKGVELSAPVNASTNHHHDQNTQNTGNIDPLDRYYQVGSGGSRRATSIVVLNGTQQEATRVSNVTNFPIGAGWVTWWNLTGVPTLSTGFVRTALRVKAHFELFTTVTGDSTWDLGFVMEFAFGSAHTAPITYTYSNNYTNGTSIVGVTAHFSGDFYVSIPWVGSPTSLDVNCTINQAANMPGGIYTTGPDSTFSITLLEDIQAF